MGLISLLVPAIVIGAIVYAVRHRSSTAAPTSHGAVGSPSAPDDRADLSSRARLEEELAEWTTAGLISPEQSAGILAHARAAQPPPAATSRDGARVPARPRRIPAVAEALGYLGATLAIVGLVLVVSRYWDDMALAGRLALSGTAAAICLIGGFLVREGGDPAFSRLRWSLWTASTAAVALFGGVAAADGLPTEAGETIALAAAGAATIESALLWRGRVRPLQQLVALTGVLVTAGAAAGEFTSGWPVGATLWLCGAVLVAVGVRHLTTTPAITLAVGGIGTVVGAAAFAAEAPGPGLLLFLASGFALTALALVPGWAAVREDQAILGSIGVLALLQAVPSTLGYFGRDGAVVAGALTWLVGAGLIVVGHRQLVRLAPVVEVTGGLAMIGGAALTGMQWHGFAPLFGIATAAGFLVLGMAPERLLLSILGSIGLLINVPWAIGWFFPGEGRVPVLIMVSGVLVLVLAVFLAHRGASPRRPGARVPPVPPPPTPS